MAVSTSYRLPGVYSVETTGPFVNATVGGNAVVALVGPAIGYIEASQQVSLTGLEAVELNEPNVISGSVRLVGRNTGITYINGTDFLESEDASGVMSIKRSLQELSLEYQTISGMTHIYYVAEPTFDIMIDGAGEKIEGYPIAGTVAVKDVTQDIDLVEGTDFDVDYHNGQISAKADGVLADVTANGDELSITFEWTTAEPIELVGESAFTLEHRFIAENGLGEGSNAYTCRIVSCKCKIGDEEYEYGDTPNADDGYEEGIDYVVDYQTGRITRTAASRIPTFSSGSNNFMYVEFAYCAIRSGEQCIATYDYAGDAYNKPRIITSYADAVKYYGSAWDTTTGDIISPISLAAYIAFQNGMSYCYACAVDGTVSVTTEYDDQGNVVTSTSVEYTTTSWEAAFDRLTYVNGIDIIVPLSDDTAVWSFGVSHLTTMQNNMDERVMILGCDGSKNIVSPSTLVALAQGFNREDVWLVGPSSFRFRNPIRSVVEPIAAYYCAAAVAGYNSSVAQYIPLTRKAVSGFYSANETATKLEKQNQCANGVMYVDEVNGQLRVLHGRTTSTVSTIKSESNVTLTKYFIIKRLRTMFEEGYIGEIITDDTLLSVKSAAATTLANMRSSNYIYDYDGLTVQIDETIPTQVDITFEYIPVYGMNYIEISFAIDSGITA